MSKIGELGNILNGSSIPKAFGTFPAYGGNGIISHVNTYNYPENTIIIGRVGANCGEVSFSIKKCWVTDNALAFCTNEEANPYYVYLLLSAMNLNQYHIGSSQPLLTQSIIRDLSFPYEKNKAKQEKIASIIRTIDSAIENNTALSSTLEETVKTLYDYWFTQFDFPNEEGKPYRSSGGKMVWNEELKREIPEGWKVTRIGKITLCHDSERIPLSGNDRATMKGAIPYYGATGIMDYVDRPIFDGDYVLLAEDGSVMDSNGNPILQRISGPTWVNNHTHVLEPVDNYTCILLMMLLKDIPVPKIKTGSIQMKINQENLNNYKIVEIPKPLKNRINKLLLPIDALLLEKKKENENLISLRDYLLPLLMNGQVTIED